MITTLKYANKVVALALLLAVLLNITVPEILPALRAQAKPELVETANCELIPIGFSSRLFLSVQAGSNIEIDSAEMPGSFSWLTWTGNPNANLLAASLTPPGNSSTYVNPDNPLDKMISIGDWVKGVPGVANSNAVGEAIAALKNTAVVVPIFDSTRSEGSNKAYKVAGYARIKILDYEFPKGNHITLQYLGNGCENVSSLKVSKTVASASVLHDFSANLSVDKEFAIPGDTLTYTTTVTETTADLNVTGTFSVTNSGDSPAKIAYFYDLIDFKQTDTGLWKNLAGAASGLSDYTPVSPSPLQTGMTLSAAGVAAAGVTYPSQGNGIAGTVISPGSTATWNYTATLLLPSEQLLPLQDPSIVSQVRNTVHFEVAPGASGSAMTYNAETDFTKALQTQISAATVFATVLTLPDGTTVSPEIGAFASGGAFSAETTYKVPPLAGRSGDETEEAYLERLDFADGSSLKATLDVSTPNGPLPQRVVTTVLQLPIVTIQKDGPAMVQPGQSAAYNLTLANTGSTQASGVLVMDLMNLDNGTFGAISGVPYALAAGESVVAQSTYNLPFPQTLDYQLPAFLTDVASVNWLDANGNFYGQFTDFFTSEVVSPYSSMVLTLSPTSAGPNLTGGQQTLSARLVDQGQNPVPGVTVYFVIEGPNAATVTQTTSVDGNAVVSYTGANNGFDNVKAYVITGLAPLQSNSSTIHWVTPKFTVTTSVIRGRFFTGSDRGSFSISPTTLPVFEQSFPSVNFNPVDRPIYGMMPEVGPATDPMTDVPVDLLGYTAGNIQMHFIDYPAFNGYSKYFSTVYTGQFLVTTAGEFTFKIRSDDGFIFGIGNGAERVAGGEWVNPPASGFTPFENYPVMGAHNTGNNPNYISRVTVKFPAPGVYPFEIDHSEGGGWYRSLTVASNQTGLTITPATALTISPFSGSPTGVRPIPRKYGTQLEFTATLVDASGLAMAGVPVTFRVRGLNAQEFTGLTDTNGKLTFAYTGSAAGTDYVQAIAAVNGAVIAVSAEPQVNWVAP